MRNIGIFLIFMFCLFLTAGTDIFFISEDRHRDFARQDNETQLLDISVFVKQTFIHGVPYEQVIKYDPDTTTPVLLELLSNPDYRAARSQIATTLGMLGDRGAIEPLIALAEEGDGELSRTDYNAKMGAIGALGFALNREMDHRAFNCLTGLAGMRSENTNRIRWASPYQADLDDRNTEIARIAIIALALSGKKEGEIFLNSLRQRNLETALPAEMKNSLNSTIEDALITNRAIQQGGKDGVKNYFNKEMQ